MDTGGEAQLCCSQNSLSPLFTNCLAHVQKSRVISNETLNLNMLAHSPLYAHAPTTTTLTRTGDGNKEWRGRPVMGTRHNLDEE
jgi:hypothetical protein